MANLRSGIPSFKTGDLIIANYPSSGEVLHFTIYLEGKSSGSLSNSGYIHAGDRVEKTDFNSYKNYGKGFLHVRINEENRRDLISDAAHVWGSTAQPTKYGSEPRNKAFESGKIANASRFSAIKNNNNLDDVRFEAAALLRSIKWSVKLMTKAPLSEKRGVTCATFIMACYQATVLREYFVSIYKNANTVKDALAKFQREYFEGDEAFKIRKERLPPIKTLDNTATFRVGQALRENSNRQLIKNVDPESYEAVDDIDRLWRVFLQEFLGVNSWDVKPIAEIIVDEIRYDAKYINSKVLVPHIESCQKFWSYAKYDSF